MATQLWLERFADAETLSETSAFRIVACVDTQLERRVFVVTAGERAARPAARAALDRLFRAHHKPPHPIIAPAIERVDISGVPIVVFDFPARLDLEELSRLAGDHGWRIDHGAADGFSITLRDAIMASGACSDPVDGRGHFLGTFALGNVLFAVDGRHVLVGFGHNVVCHDERGRLSVRQRFFQAPEIAVGYPATAVADIVAMVAMTRTMMAFVNVHEAITRCLVGNNIQDDLELVGHIIWYETRVMRAATAARASYDEMVVVSNRIRELIRTRPDAAAFERAVAGLLLEGRPDLFAPRAKLQVARDGSWFVTNEGDRIEARGEPTAGAPPEGFRGAADRRAQSGLRGGGPAGSRLARGTNGPQLGHQPGLRGHQRAPQGGPGLAHREVAGGLSAEPEAEGRTY